MALTLSNAVRDALVDAAVADVDGAATAGKLRIYDGARPAGPDTAVGAQVLLVEFTLADPSFSPSAGGTATLDADPDLSAPGAADGTAAWCRFVNGDNVAVIDGSVGTTGADVNLSTVNISTGVTVTITDGTLTMPAG